MAAAARAARDVLVNRFPAQSAAIHAKYLAFLADHRLTEADEGTIAVTISTRIAVTTMMMTTRMIIMAAAGIATSRTGRLRD